MCSVLKFASYSWESILMHTPTGTTTTTNEILTGNQITRTQTKPAQITVATTATIGYNMYKGSFSVQYSSLQFILSPTQALASNQL